jgi:hypothetical protein
MAQVKNTFVKSKMNRDLDARLMPNGEYREGRNIGVSKSEGSDVGALENIKGNVNIFPGFINKLNANLTPNEKPLEIIGMFTHEDSSSIYMFLTTFSDASKNQLENHANVFSSHCYVTRIKYNGNLTLPEENRYESSILVEGSFLNFSKTHPISGFNIVEDLMFWTDNRNSPRKINIEKAAGLAKGDALSRSFYYREDQISVAKYYPYNSFSLIRRDGSNYTSTVKNVTTEWLPISLSAPLDSIKTVGSNTVLNFRDLAQPQPAPPASKPNWTGTGAQNSSIANFFSKTGSNDYPVVRIKNAQKPGSQDLYIYNVTGNEAGVAISQTSLTTQVSIPTAPDGSTWADPGDVIIFQLKNPDFDISFDGDREFLKDKFPRFSYRFKYTDNEYSLMAPFTQPVFMPAQDGSITWQDEDVATKTTELGFFENRASEIGLVINLPYYPGGDGDALYPTFNFELQRELHIDEIEILIKTSNDNNIYIVDNVDISSGGGCPPENLVAPDGASQAIRNQFIYKYRGEKPYKVVPESDVTRVNDIVPVRALAQETSGNRIMYGNYVDNHALPPKLWYEVNHSLKTGSFNPDFNVANNPPIATTINNKIKEYYNATIKQGRTYQVGVVLSDRYGRQSTVMLASESEDYGNNNRDRSTVFMPYNNSGSTSTLNFFGSSLKMDWHLKIPDIEDYNTLNYPGLYNINTRPSGWYSYKIVVKQQEQEYYNVYLPGSMSGNVIYKDNETKLNYSDSWNTSNLSLYGDNINKIPRDMTNVGPTDRIYGSKESLYYRVVQPNYNFSAQSTPATVETNRWNSRQTVLPVLESTVVTIQPFLDLGTWVTQKGVTSSLAYPGAYDDSGTVVSGTIDPLVKSDNNPFVANVNNNENKDRVGFLNTTQISSSSTDLAKFSQSLIVAETKPKLSNLELYWETATSGLISDLNSSILTTGISTAPKDLTTFLFEGQESIEYTGANLATCLLNKNVNIVTNAGVENSNINYDIKLLSVKSIDKNGQESDCSLFEIKSFPSAIPAAKEYNLYLTSAARETLQYNSDDDLNVWNKEFVFNFELTIVNPNPAGPPYPPAFVSKRNNFFSNNAPLLGATVNPSPVNPSDTANWAGDTWAFSIGGEEPDSGQTDYDYVKKEHLFEKTSGGSIVSLGIGPTDYNITAASRSRTRNRNQHFFNQDKWTQYNTGTVPYPLFPPGNTTWNNGSFKGLTSGAELYIEKLECAINKGNDTEKFDFQEWWTLKKLGVTDADRNSGTIVPKPDWFTDTTAIWQDSPQLVDLSGSAYGSQNLRYTYYDYPWKVEFVDYNSSSPAPWLNGNGFDPFTSGWYLLADGNNPPFEWQGAATEKSNNRFWAEGFLNGGQYSVHKITIGVRETFANGQVSQLGQLVVYVKLYR